MGVVSDQTNVRWRRTAVSLLVLAAAVPACGDHDKKQSTEGPLTLDSVPTAVIARPGDDATASSFAQELRAGAKEMAAIVLAPGLPDMTGLPGVDVTNDCPAGGQVTLSGDSGADGIAAGLVVTATYHDCKTTDGDGTTTRLYNGVTETTWTRYADSNHQTYAVAYKDVSYQVISPTYIFNAAHLEGTQFVDVSDGVAAVYYGLSRGVTDVSLTKVVVGGDTAAIDNALYVLDSEVLPGIVRVTYSNWHFDVNTGQILLGTVSVAGAADTQATMTVADDPVFLTLEFRDADGNVEQVQVPNV